VGKPSAPAAPDYAAAADKQGVANVNSAVATSRLNQANQVGPYGSLKYSYGTKEDGGGYTDPQTGQWIPQVTATTTLDPAQQRLLDQNNTISGDLNDLALKGIGYVGQASANPMRADQFGKLNTGLALAPDASALRDKITAGYMERLQPYLDHDKQALNTQLANQGIQVGSDAYGHSQEVLGKAQNDQRIAALLAGDQEQQNVFNRGLSSAQFQNQAQQQAIQEADYFKNQPLNMLNALRSGNQVTTPQFGNVTAGAQVGAAPIYQATNDQYNAALKQYQAEMAANPFSSALGALGTIGAAGITKFSDRRLKTGIRKIGEMVNGLGVYVYTYIWGGPEQIGVMADEVEKIRPAALGPKVLGYQTVNYGAL
jgi:hypothetical protein